MAGLGGSTRAGDFAHELGRALADRGLTLNRLARRLEARGAGQEMSTLIGWRSGRLVPQLGTEEIAALEQALELPDGHLGGAVPAQEPRLPAVARARAALGFNDDVGLVARRVAIHLEVDERGAERTISQRTTWVVQRDGVRAFPVVAVVQAPVTEPARVEAVRGCRTGRRYGDEATGVFATRLVLPRRLRAGQEVETEHRTHLPRDVQPEPTYEHRVLHRVEELELAVTFHPHLLPRACRFFSRVDGVETATDLDVRSGPLRAAADGFGPGAVGFHWEW